MGADATTLIDLRLTVTLQGALHIGTGLGLAQILDDRIVQGPHPHVDTTEGVDLPYLPGSSLKGRLRHHVRQLSTLLGEYHTDAPGTSALRLFGSPTAAGGLSFSDAYIADIALARQLAGDKRNPPLAPLFARSERSFVALSRGRRIALDQRLFRLELADSGLVFATDIRGRLDARAARYDLALLLAATRDLTHLGGHKGRGLGHCSVDVVAVRVDGADQDVAVLLEALR
jgi:CRISPR/Cas system CSM-associated protein Csm3 (group 7 of RAMP superfamily)